MIEKDRDTTLTQILVGEQTTNSPKTMLPRSTNNMTRTLAHLNFKDIYDNNGQPQASSTHEHH